MSNGTASRTVDVAAQSTRDLHFQVTGGCGDANKKMKKKKATVASGHADEHDAEVEFPVVSALKSSDPAKWNSANPTPVSTGETISYTITGSNTGLAAAKSATGVGRARGRDVLYVLNSADNAGYV